MTTTSITQTIPKRVRFAVLARDNHTCTYCGATPADGIKLVVDHVVPVALGGESVPENLTTACAPCNSGKSSTSPTEQTVAAVSSRTITWAAAMKAAAAQVAADDTALRAQHEVWRSRWDAWSTNDGASIPLPDDWANSLTTLLSAGANFGKLVDLIEVAMRSKATSAFRYFCGCGWTHVRNLQGRAHALIEAAENHRDDSPAAGLMSPQDEAYWSGHVAGYSTGYDDGWEFGQAAGRAERDAHASDPEPLGRVLADLTPRLET